MTVDALIEATAGLLVKEGFDGLSTNKIAQAAGVSIGSLYQYYPTKEALVAAVIDRHQHKVAELVRNAMADIMALPLETATRVLVNVAVQAHRVDPKLHRILTEQIPRTGRLRNVEAQSRGNFALVRAWLEAHRGEIRGGDLDLAAFVFATTLEALTHSAVLHQPELLAGAGAKRFVDETTRLLVGYLR